MKRSFIALSGLLIAARVLSAQTINDFFDGSTLQEFRLTMTAADWQTLHDKYLDKKTNYHCDFTWHGITVKNVGIHTRGTGSLNPIKPGIGIEFGKFVTGQTFLTMDSLVLRNFSEDPTGLHERLAMEIFQRVGLPYLRVMHAKMYVNDQYVGLYEVVEPIDTRFIRTHFAETDGYIYEAQGGLNYHFDYIGDDPTLYIPTYFDPKNHTDDPQAAAMRDMVRTMNQASDAQFVSAMSSYFDLGTFVAYAAGEAFLAEIDGLLSTSGMTNFYLYRRLADNRWFFLPWDRELTFTASNWSIWAYTQDNVLLRRCLAIPELRQRFMDTIHLLSDGIGGTGGWLDKELERLYQQVRQAMLDDPSRVCVVNDVFTPCPAQSFEDAVGYLRYFPKERAAFVVQSLKDAGWTQNSQAPAPDFGALANAASGVTILAPGELATVNVSLSVGTAQRAQSYPLPTDLAQASVKVAGVAVPMIQASPTGVLFQTPTELLSGPTSVTVSANGYTSPTLPVEVRPVNPGIFAAAHTNGNLVTSVSPAQSGELLVIWATGLGRAKSDDASGKPASANPLVELRDPVTVTIGGASSDVVFAGLAPGYAGLQIVLVKVPAVSGTSGTSSLLLTSGGEPGAAYNLPVR